jgi:hypothetical protein
VRGPVVSYKQPVSFYPAIHKLLTAINAPPHVPVSLDTTDCFIGFAVVSDIFIPFYLNVLVCYQCVGLDCNPGMFIEVCLAGAFRCLVVVRAGWAALRYDANEII